jgi:hypothetical protein
MMEVVFNLLQPLGQAGTAIALFNPVPVTVLFAILLVLLLRFSGLWAHHKRLILLVPVALYAIDTAIAVPRLLYAWRSPAQPVIAETTAISARLVFVNQECGKECHDLLLAGLVDEIVLVSDRLWSAEVRPPVRYRVGWSVPGACPRERETAMGWEQRASLLPQGFCPDVQPTEMPAEGIFIVAESFGVRASEPAVSFKPRYLISGPPGKTIAFTGIEVQRRTKGRVEVLAAARYYAAPGLLGFPPLIGCWLRPENIIWTLPPGDTGCGFWRWFTGGGNDELRSTGGRGASWIYTHVLRPPDRQVVAPVRPDIAPPTPAEALEILGRVDNVEDFLPGLREPLLSPSLSDEAIAQFVARRATRRQLEGPLISFLAAERPAAALAIPAHVSRPAALFRSPSAVVEQMDRHPAIRDGLAEFMLDSLSSTWVPKDEGIDRFFALMRKHDPDWLCQRLEKFTRPGGIIETRDTELLKKSISREPQPAFVVPLIKETYPRCGQDAVDLLRALLASSSHARREEIASSIDLLPEEAAARVADQALANVLDSTGMKEWVHDDASRRKRYLAVHLRLLRKAGVSCEHVAAHVRKSLVNMPSELLSERLVYLEGKERDRWHPCYSDDR